MTHSVGPRPMALTVRMMSVILTEAQDDDHHIRFLSVAPKEVTMKVLVQLAIATALLTSAFAASAQGLTEAQARAVIAPWYSLFNQPVQGDMKTLQEQVLTTTQWPCGSSAPDLTEHEQLGPCRPSLHATSIRSPQCVHADGGRVAQPVPPQT